MATCPQFNLFVPHKCPDPKPLAGSCTNFTIRSARRAMGFGSKTFDRRLIHSRFCPVQTFRVVDSFYTYAQFIVSIFCAILLERRNYGTSSFNEFPCKLPQLNPTLMLL